MLTVERKALILQRLESVGRVVAKEMSLELELSEDTIRRDLRELAAEGLLQRVHGGALPASKALADLPTRRKVQPADKAAIAKAAAGMIKNGQTVFLDGGTTAIALARSLAATDLQATVVTHSPDVAVALHAHGGVEVELIGGRLYKHSNVTVGAVAIEEITSIRPDIYFMGVTGIHPEYGLTTGNREEAAVKRAISRQSAETVVLASREKLGAVSAHSVVPLDQIDSLLVARSCPPDLIDPFTSLGVSIVHAGA
ncbi:DeoR/GlpR family DNA-binding transcription regulator [Rhizobium sp. XQZ8]|uniref:DeoR/GlpR family DNA-binding transcription regulator n=1 Tax=Rhizobium populisoli TaxID=2859785 RepID=UPI001C66CCFF|nr:DeoR/GlpR family DNA-binding transcription regulator [Rhizobium populisoli]MBW6425563.1 DeoR/GlpR family DNA-binding transcription regulator [Rhizobium populisoli]